MDASTGDSSSPGQPKQKPMPTSFPDILALKSYLDNERGFKGVVTKKGAAK